MPFVIYASWLDDLKYLPVRFHLFSGEQAWSYIERGKFLVSQVVANLKRHMIITDKDSMFLHWFFPGKELLNGLRPLNDVYTKVVHENSEYKDESDSDYELEEEEESSLEGDDYVVSVPIAIASLSNDLERYGVGSDCERES